MSTATKAYETRTVAEVPQGCAYYPAACDARAVGFWEGGALVGDVNDVTRRGFCADNTHRVQVREGLSADVADRRSVRLGVHGPRVRVTRGTVAGAVGTVVGVSARTGNLSLDFGWDAEQATFKRGWAKPDMVEHL